jgi:hypothetical protein
MSMTKKVINDQTNALAIPDPIFVERRISVNNSISAVQLIGSEGHGSPKLGLLSQLGPGSILEVCGQGFNERTVKVRCNDLFYFVFRQDIGD